jgi:crossover junction endodeoxyribonuclease RuvC
LQTDKIILGIDPGTSLLGYGLIHIKEKNISLIKMGVIHLSKLQSHDEKLKKIFSRILNLVDEYKPNEVAIEAPFYGKNIQSMLKLGRAQGVAMAASLYRNIPIFEYAPKKIKMAITGNGNASKEQLSEMIKKILNLKGNIDKKLDATDALGAALCHYYQKSNNESPRKSWKKFIQANPEKII